MINDNIKMKMLIDCREHFLIKYFSSLKNPLIQSKNIFLGDVQFVSQDTSDKEKICMICERKTVKDLAASIKDGRYVEQKHRLLSFRQNNPFIKIGYIIEGYYSFSSQFTNSNMGNKCLSGAIINSMLRDNIHVWIVHNEGETIDLLENLFTRFTKETNKYFPHILSNSKVHSEIHSEIQTENNNEVHNEKTVDNYIHAAVVNFHGTHAQKKENLDEKLCLILQLTCIPGLSSTKAKDIVDTLKIKSICHLCRLLREDDIYNEGKSKKDQRNTLQKISGIGPKLQSVIRKFLLVKENEPSE